MWYLFIAKNGCLRSRFRQKLVFAMLLKALLWILEPTICHVVLRRGSPNSLSRCYFLRSEKLLLTQHWKVITMIVAYPALEGYNYDILPLPRNITCQVHALLLSFSHRFLPHSPFPHPAQPLPFPPNPLVGNNWGVELKSKKGSKTKRKSWSERKRKKRKINFFVSLRSEKNKKRKWDTLLGSLPS